jgi:Mg-chelatase subunit ChlD
VGLTAEEVNRAIDRGAAYLWGQVKDGKVKGGELALSWQALIHAGTHKKIPECDAAARRFIEQYNVNEGGSYESGIFCMLVDAYGDPRYLPKLRAKARNLMEAQGPKGLWGYECRPLPREYTNAAARLGPADAWARLTPRHEGGDGDNSASQFGLLGMYAAARNGVTFEPDVWRRNLQMARRRQGDDGGWAYTTRSSSYGSMTCAGVCAVAIDRYHLGETDPAADEAIDLGLGWLDAHFTVEVNPPGQSHHYYYLYSLERVGRILNTEFIGQHEWYPLGAKFLVGSQKKDGSWTEGSDPILGTSFALLFLTRATPSLAQAPERRKDEKGRLQTLAAETGSMRLYVILDASGSMLEEMDGKQKFQVATDALTGLIEALPDTAEVGLRVYGHTKRAIDQGANEDTELVRPMGKLDKAGMLQTVAGLRARGKTPLALSLREAARDLAGAGSDDKPVTVVLLTDGMEDTFPRQDPLKAADEFAQVKNVKLHVVGFDIGRADWAEALAALTSRARGQYWPAPRADKLSARLRSAARGMPDEYTLLSKDGQAVGAGTYGDTQTLAPGEYRLTAAMGERLYEQSFAIQPGLTTRLSFDSARVITNAAAVAAPPSTAPAVVPAPAPAKEAPAGAAAPRAKFCTACGAQTKPGAKFCAGCGAPLK